MNISSALFISAMLLTAVSSSCAQSRITKDQFEVSNFTAIESSIVGNINISQSPRTGVIAEGDEDLLDILEVRMENNTLVLNMSERNIKRFNNRKEKLDITITTPTLTYVNMEGVGNLNIEGVFETPELIIDSEGVGNMKALNINAGFVKIESEGVGNITVAGRSDEVEITSEGVGNIDAGDLVSLSTIAVSEGIGNVSCHATGYLRAVSEGIGNITYYGNPKQTDLSKNGIGKIRAGR